MRKIGIGMLVGVAVLGMVKISSAADVKISGKVDVRQNLGGINATETGFNMKAFNLREARLTAKSAITDKISAQISNNFAVPLATLEANNAGLGNTYVTMGLGDGTLLLGQTTLPGFAIRETIANKECLGTNLTDNNITQVNYSGKAEAVTYAIAIYDGGVTTKGAQTKDAVINVGVDVSGAKIGVTYNADTNDDDTVKGSFFAANVGYKLNPVDLTLQFIGGLDKKVTGGATEKDISDATEDAPTSEMILEVGYKIGEKHNLTVGYDMFGKSNAILLKSTCKIVDGVSCILRADILGSDLKKVDPIANNISLGIAAEF